VYKNVSIKFISANLNRSQQAALAITSSQSAVAEFKKSNVFNES